MRGAESKFAALHEPDWRPFPILAAALHTLERCRKRPDCPVHCHAVVACSSYLLKRYEQTRAGRTAVLNDPVS